MTKLWRFLLIVPSVIAMSGCVDTEHVMKALPAGTVILLGQEPVHPIPASWGKWQDCPSVENWRNSTFIYIDQKNPGTYFNGQSFTNTFQTTDPVGGGKYHAGPGDNPPPVAMGTDHKHNVTINIPAGSYEPPAIKVACLEKR